LQRYIAVEDLLPYFPDFTVIDEFKDAVLEELGKYSKRIDDSRAAMDKAGALAEQIKGEIAEIKQRVIRLPWDAPCARCGGVITLPPQSFAAFAVQGQDPEAVEAASPLSKFYAFPCGMAFHTTCLVEAGLPWMAPGQRRRCLDLMAVVQPPLTRELKKLCKRWAGRDRTERLAGMQQIAGGGSAAGDINTTDNNKNSSGSGGGLRSSEGAAASGGRAAGEGASSSSAAAAGGAGGGRGGGAGDGKDAPGLGGAGASSSAKAGTGKSKAAAAAEAAAEAAAAKKGDKAEAVEQLEDLLCEECPYCGEMMLRQINAPFIDDADDTAEEAESWKI
jgi:hypothetical protein